MAREYGQIRSAIWRRGGVQHQDVAKWAELSPLAQWAYMMLTTQSDITACGTLGLTLRRWAGNAAGMTAEALADVLDELRDRGYVIVDWDDQELLCTTFIYDDNGYQPRNKLRRKAITSAANAVASPEIRTALAVILDGLEIPHELGDADGPSDTPPEGALDTPSDTPSEAPSEGSSDTPSEGVCDTPRVVVMKRNNRPQPSTLEPQPASLNPVLGGSPSEGTHHAPAQERTPPSKTDDSETPTTPAPSRFCAKHPTGAPGACGLCADARFRYDQHHAREASRLAVERVRLERQAQSARYEEHRAKIDACTLCDSAGKLLADKRHSCHHIAPGARQRAEAALRSGQPERLHATAVGQ